MRRGLRTIARAMAVLLACALVLASVRASAVYFACARMGVVAEHACCAGKSAKPGKPDKPADAECKATRTCCEPIAPMARGGLRMIHATPAPDVEAAPWLGVVPPAPVVPHEATSLLTASRVARAGPPPRAPTPSFLSVYLI